MEYSTSKPDRAGAEESKKALIECSACCDYHFDDEVQVIEGDVVCHACICTMFCNAIDDESNYPPRWGQVELSLEKFEPVLGVVLADKYYEKMAEYNVRWDDRVYCTAREASGSECGHYMGKKTGLRIRIGCPKCRTARCMCCKDRIILLREHECKSAVEEEEIFKGLVKGKDWQKCPNCPNKFQLLDGCNHVHCNKCNKSLCFVCGQPAAANSNHWSRSDGSRCPRYNQPGAANAMFDEEAFATNHGWLEDVEMDMQLFEALERHESQQRNRRTTPRRAVTPARVRGPIPPRQRRVGRVQDPFVSRANPVRQNIHPQVRVDTPIQQVPNQISNLTERFFNLRRHPGNHAAMPTAAQHAASEPGPHLPQHLHGHHAAMPNTTHQISRNPSLDFGFQFPAQQQVIPNPLHFEPELEFERRVRFVHPDLPGEGA